MKKVLFVLGYVWFLILVVELALQAFYYFNVGQFLFTRTGIPLWKAEPYAGIGMKPNLDFKHNTNEFRTVVHTNSRGFRTSAEHEEYPYDKKPGTLRMMLLGPSFAFGWGVNYEETFAVRLAKILQDNGYSGGRNVEVINTGVPSLGPSKQFRWYKHEGIRYRPDLVIQFIYGSMAAPSDPGDYLFVNNEGHLINRNASLATRIRGKTKKSAIVFYSWITYLRIEKAFSGSQEGGHVMGAGLPLEIRTAFNLKNQAVQDAMSFYEDLRKTVASGGGRLLVVYFPLSCSIHPEDMARWRHLGEQNVDWQIVFNRGFCDHLNEFGIDCINLTDAFLQAVNRNGKRLYNLVDVHWTLEGNRVAAEAVSRHLLPEPKP